MTNQPGQQPKQAQPPVGFYTLLGTIAFGLAVVIFYLIASYFAK
jgi:hypothetical protein